MKKLKLLISAAVLVAATIVVPASPAAASQPSWCSSVPQQWPHAIAGGVAYYWGTGGNDSIRPVASNGSWNRVSISGGGGNDVLCGDPTLTNFLYGDAGNDNIAGGSNADHIVPGSGGDDVYAGAGNDTIDQQTFLTSEYVIAGSGYDRVILAGSCPPPLGTWSSVESCTP